MSLKTKVVLSFLLTGLALIGLGEAISSLRMLFLVGAVLLYLSGSIFIFAKKGDQSIPSIIVDGIFWSLL